MTLKECDLVMKGGLASGVVYPGVIAALAHGHRFRGIAGTSAGAIAAVLTAAAELCRQRCGDETFEEPFQKIADIGEELVNKLEDLFQPDPDLRNLFEVVIGMTRIPEGRGWKTHLILSMLSQYRLYWWPLAAAFFPGFVLLIYAGSYGLALSVLLVSAILIIASVLGRAALEIFHVLPQKDFGLCSGLQMDGHTDPGFTEWMHAHIQDLAGRSASCRPLTIGELKKEKIEIAAMTTDLSSERPYQLPLRARILYFREEEMLRVFPKTVVEYLKNTGGKDEKSRTDGPDDFYHMPVGDDFPALLVARMSLSYPLLIRPVALWREDQQQASPTNGARPLVRCLFSDGGISSNFPIHFFDRLAPRRPTFGIQLSSVRKGDESNRASSRVTLGQERGKPPPIRHQALSSVPQFAMAILNTARNWQDTLQANLPGYWDRNVEIRLKDETEGGYNIRMDHTTIRNLRRYGCYAGLKLRQTFDFDKHRADRADATYPKVIEALSKIRETADSEDDYLDAITAPREDRIPSADWLNTDLKTVVLKLAKLGGEHENFRANLPDSDGQMRLTANADEQPMAPAQSSEPPATPSV